MHIIPPAELHASLLATGYPAQAMPAADQSSCKTTAAAMAKFDGLPIEVVRLILKQITDPMQLDTDVDNLTQWCQLASVCKM